MRFTFLTTAFLAVQSAFFAQSPTHSLSEKQYFQKKQEEEAKKALAAKPPSPETKSYTSEVMIISPELRAKDFQSAFTYLKTKNPSAKIGIELADHSIVSDILHIEIMPGGTLVIFTVSTVKGVKYRIVKTENIRSIHHV